jgi:DNA polymerase I
MKRLVAYDLETHVVQPGLRVPPIVVGALCSVEVGDQHAGEVSEPVLLWPTDAAVDALVAVLEDRDAVLVGHNVAYDLACAAQHALSRGRDLMPLIHEALADGRVLDTRLVEKLHAIGRGHLGFNVHAPWVKLVGDYNLDVVVEQVLGRVDAKDDDEWQLRYHELERTPPERWPEAAVRYPKADVRNTILVALAQLGFLPRRGRHHWADDGTCLRCGGRDNAAACMAVDPALNLEDAAEQARAAWALHLGGAHGFDRDPEAAKMVREVYAREHDGADGPFLAAGILRADGSEDQGALRRRIVAAYDPAAGACPTCAEPQAMPPLRGKPRPPQALAGKVRNAKNTDWVNCPECRGTGLEIGPAVPRTDKDGVKTDRDTLFESGDDLLVEYGEFGEAGKIPTTLLPWLERDPGVPKCVDYDSLLVTNRVSARGPIQTFSRTAGGWKRDPRTGEKYYSPSPREVVRARRGKVQSSSDYEAGEMVTWAEDCYQLLGWSALGEALKKDVKPHSLLGARVLGVSYEDFEARRAAGEKLVEGVRQVCKIFNFGCAGGMGVAAIVMQARQNRDVNTPARRGPVMVRDEAGSMVPGYRGIRFCVVLRGRERCGARKITEWRDRPCAPICGECAELAADLKDAWSRQWPESKGYFAAAGADADAGVVVHETGFVRAGHGFCAVANGRFQERLARAAKRAHWRITRECYDASRGSILLGARAPGFIHDEMLGEHDLEVAPEQAERFAAIMVEALQEECPHVASACRVEPALMYRWDKRAKAVRDPSGRLVPWVAKDSPWRDAERAAGVYRA